MIIKKIAILGVNLVSIELSTYLVNLGYPVVLFLLPCDTYFTVDDILNCSYQFCPRNKLANYIEILELKDNLSSLSKCDLIIANCDYSCIDDYRDLYLKIVPYVNSDSVVIDNTSLMSINSLADIFPRGVRANYCGVHFFSPINKITLVELVPHAGNTSKFLDELECFLTVRIGREVVRLNDTPLFLANRIIMFMILLIYNHSLKLKIPLEVVDQLCKKMFSIEDKTLFEIASEIECHQFITFLNIMQEKLSDDPWCEYYKKPTSILGFCRQNNLKNLQIYKTDNKDIKIYDPYLNRYRIADQRVDLEVWSILNIPDPYDRFSKLYNSDNPQAKLLSSVLTNLFCYCAYHSNAISSSLKDFDVVVSECLGLGKGIFQLWRDIGFLNLSQLFKQNAAKNLISINSFVSRISSGNIDLQESDILRNLDSRYLPPIEKPDCYNRQINDVYLNRAAILYLDDHIQLSLLNGDIGILSFKTRFCTIGSALLEGILRCLDIAVVKLKGLVIWQYNDKYFGYGADLREIKSLYTSAGEKALRSIVHQFQQVSLALRYSDLPIIAAVRGLTLGGSCEFMMHCDAIVAALDSNIGLVEPRIGLLPAAGGIKELAKRIHHSKDTEDFMLILKKFFIQVFYGQKSFNAIDAYERSFLTDQDIIVPNKKEVLYIAIKQAKFLAEIGYKAPWKAKISAMGVSGIKYLQNELNSFYQKKLITDYDYAVGMKLAYCLCGGEVEEGTILDEQEYLFLEADKFMELAVCKKTQDRISHMIATGQYLKN